MNAPAILHVPARDMAIEQADPAILALAARSDVHLALWWRPLPDDLAWLAAFEWDHIDDLDFPTQVMDLATTVPDALVEAGYPVDARGRALAADIAGLARRFAAVFDLASVNIRLEVIETDACRKFHVDAVTARLLTTFVGQGTQWRRVSGEDGAIRQMRVGDVGIFKGRLSVEEPAILHRSPPIAASGETRLLLAIDPAQPAFSTDALA